MQLPIPLIFTEEAKITTGSLSLTGFKIMQATHLSLSRNDCFAAAAIAGVTTLTWIYIDPDLALHCALAGISGLAISRLLCVSAEERAALIAKRRKAWIQRQTPEYNAATTIQKFIRGKLVRKSHFPPGSYPQYRVQWNKLQPNWREIPRAPAGCTMVYMPVEMPGIVLKQSGRETAIRRFHQMQYVRAILVSQKSSHLIIPRVNLCEDCLVEERLPINVNRYHNMGLYVSQLKLFDEPVRELTRLFSKRPISDLLTNDGENVRYDNLPFYIAEENGQKRVKIGLIDLDGGPASNLATLARIFPYHLDEIKDEAEKLGWKFDESSLNDAAERGEKYLHVEYIDHLAFLKQKSDSPHLSPRPFQVSVERVKELTTPVVNELLKITDKSSDLFTRHGYYDIPKITCNNPQEIAERVIPLIINNIQDQIEKNQGSHSNLLSTQDISESQLINSRSPSIELRALYEGVREILSETLQFEHDEFQELERTFIPEQLVFIIMEELIKSGEIYHFDFCRDYPRIRY